MFSECKNRPFSLSPSQREAITRTTAVAGTVAVGGFIPRAAAASGLLSF
jgi:hypothetical protein